MCEREREVGDARFIKRTEREFSDLETRADEQNFHKNNMVTRLFVTNLSAGAGTERPGFEGSETANEMVMLVPGGPMTPTARIARRECG